MSNKDYVEKMFKNIEIEQERKQEEQREEAIVETAGLFRRIWREIRAGLLNEGVPEDLVDDATLSFIRMTSSGNQG